MKAKLSFKPNRYRTRNLPSRREKKLKRILICVFSLLLLNFAWDGYKRKKELSEYYGLSKQYYGIILNEAGKAADKIKDKIKQIDIKRK